MNLYYIDHYPISVEPVVAVLRNALCERPFQFVSVTTYLGCQLLNLYDGCVTYLYN